LSMCRGTCPRRISQRGISEASTTNFHLERIGVHANRCVIRPKRVTLGHSSRGMAAWHAALKVSRSHALHCSSLTHVTLLLCVLWVVRPAHALPAPRNPHGAVGARAVRVCVCLRGDYVRVAAYPVSNFFKKMGMLRM
jgi:hypothetical protein